MKKNKMLRLASALLIMVMLTTSIVGGTFAKYTTTGRVSDTARVAKWGVVINTSGSLYSDAYAAQAAVTKGDLPAAWNDCADVAKITVAAATENDNIVAPGTKSYENGLSFSISGAPEVAVKVTTSITAEDIYLKAGIYGVLAPITLIDNVSLKEAVSKYPDKVYGFKNGAYTKQIDTTDYDADTTYYILTDKAEVVNDYFPVKYMLTGVTSAPASNKAIDVAKTLADKICGGAASGTSTGNYKMVYSGISHDYPANTDLGNGAAGPSFANKKLSWEWPIENGDNEDAKKAATAADTILGDMIAARGGSGTHKFVSITTAADNTETVTALTIGNGTDDFTVKDASNAVVANLRTSVDITLEVTQID